MKIVVCVDDNGGMLFNQRRQSRDAILLEDMLSMVEEMEGKLWIAPFSEKLIKPYMEERPFITIDENYWDEAEAQDFCFVENETPMKWNEKIDSIILYRWNRVYPADTYFDMDLRGWQLISTGEFSGASHERITKEVYTR